MSETNTSASNTLQRLLLRFSENASDLLILLDGHFVDNPQAVGNLTTILSQEPCCLLVVGAPPGSGKSTFIGKTMTRVLQETPQRRIYYFSGLVDLYEQRKLPKTVLLSSIFPKGAVLVFDQMDDRELSPEKKDWIVQLATQARNSGKLLCGSGCVLAGHYEGYSRPQ